MYILPVKLVRISEILQFHWSDPYKAELQMVLSVAN